MPFLTRQKKCANCSQSVLQLTFVKLNWQFFRELKLGQFFVLQIYLVKSEYFEKLDLIQKNSRSATRPLYNVLLLYSRGLHRVNLFTVHV